MDNKLKTYDVSYEEFLNVVTGPHPKRVTLYRGAAISALRNGFGKSSLALFFALSCYMCVISKEI